MGTRARFGALATLACALTFTACGGGDEKGTIPTDAGNALLDQLAQIDTAVARGDCETAQTEAVAFAQNVSDLTEEVDSEVREALVEAGGNLSKLSLEQCESVNTGATGETDATTDEPPPPPDTEPPVEEPPAPDEPPAEDPTPPGNGNSGNGNGGGSGGDDQSGGIGSGD